MYMLELMSKSGTYFLVWIDSEQANIGCVNTTIKEASCGKNPNLTVFCKRSLRKKCPYFHAFGLNLDIYGVNLRIQFECEKI